MKTPALFLFCIGLCGLIAMPLRAAPATPPDGKIGAEVYAQLAAAPTATVVVIFGAPAQTRSNHAARTATLKTTADAVLAALPAGDFTLRHRFHRVAALALEAGPETVKALRADPLVLRVDLDVGGEGHMHQSAPLARVSNVRDLGWIGEGVKVGILDSGIRSSHFDLAGNLVGEHCFCSSATPGTGCCPNGQDEQAGAGSAADGAGHGTNVAGIITGTGSHAPTGGAPGTKVVMVRMLDDYNSFYTSYDIAAGLDWLAANHPDLRVVNMSVGTSALFTNVCDTSAAWATAVYQAAQALALNGTVLTASAGNQGSATQISMPACLSNVLAIGAVWDAALGSQTMLGCTDGSVTPDLPTCFSNSGNNIALYAPGAYVTSTGHSSDTGIATWGGTSQAAPLTAACVADLMQMHPGATPAEIEAALAATPVQVVDPKNGRSFPRLDCHAAMIHLDTIHKDGFE